MPDGRQRSGERDGRRGRRERLLRPPRAEQERGGGQRPRRRRDSGVTAMRIAVPNPQTNHRDRAWILKGIEESYDQCETVNSEESLNSLSDDFGRAL